MGTFVCRHSEIHLISEFKYWFYMGCLCIFKEMDTSVKKKYKGTSKSDINDKICTIFKLDFAICPFLSS